jgi:hypothetical protein
MGRFPGAELANHSPPSSIEAKNVVAIKSYNSTSLDGLEIH